MEFNKLQKDCEELGLRFCGEQPDSGAFFFQVINRGMVCCGASFAVYETSRRELVFSMNQTEMKWINHKIKEDNNHA